MPEHETGRSLDAPLTTAENPGGLRQTDERSVVVVVVTYGRRLGVLRRTIAALDDSLAVNCIIVVDNGSDDPVTAAALSDAHPISIIRLPGNVGSAGGFARGIAAALEISDARCLAILDDDNLGEDKYLESLIALHRDRGGGDDVALSALRADRPHLRALLQRPSARAHRPAAFLGFHLSELPARILRRLGRRQRAEPAAVHIRPIRLAPYGGLFLTLAAVRRVGLPRADFVLYGDDHEYTRRFQGAGITLFLTDRPQIADIDESWNLAPRRGSPWIGTGQPTWRIYYAARNHLFLERTDKDASPAMHGLNGLIFSARLMLEALIRFRSLPKARHALRPFRTAAADARRGHLGPHPDYRLPGWQDTAPDTDAL